MNNSIQKQRNGSDTDKAYAFHEKSPHHQLLTQFHLAEARLNPYSTPFTYSVSPRSQRWPAWVNQRFQGLLQPSRLLQIVTQRRISGATFRISTIWQMPLQYSSVDISAVLHGVLRQQLSQAGLPTLRRFQGIIHLHVVHHSSFQLTTNSLLSGIQ